MHFSVIGCQHKMKVKRHAQCLTKSVNIKLKLKRVLTVYLSTFSLSRGCVRYKVPVRLSIVKKGLREAHQLLDQ